MTEKILKYLKGHRVYISTSVDGPNCKNCTAVFYSREEAIRAGYRPCKVCKP